MPKKPRTRHWAVLCGLLALAAAVRLYQSGESLWLDELHTAWVIERGPGEIPLRAGFGNQSPLYFYLPWLSTRCLGASEWSIRLPSLLAGTALVILAFHVAWQWTESASASLLASWLFAVDPHCIFYAQEARPYALVQLAGLAHVFVFWRLQAEPRMGLRIANVLGGGLLFWLHYTAALLLLAEWVWYLLAAGRRGRLRRYRWPALLTDLGCLSLLCLPALPHLLAVAQRRGNWSTFIPQRDFWNALQAAVSWFSLPAYLLLPAGLAAVAALAAAWRARRQARASADQRDEPEAGPRNPAGRLRLWLHSYRRPAPAACSLLACWLLVPLLTAWLATQADLTRLFYPRYLIASALAPLLAGSLLVASCRLRLVRLGSGLLVAAAALHNSGMPAQLLRDGRLLAERNQPWRAAIDHINREQQHADLPVFVRSGFIEADQLRQAPTPLLRDYCLAPVHNRLYRVNRPSSQLIPLPTTAAGQLAAEEIERIRDRGGGWFLILGSRRSQQQFAHQLQETFLRAGIQPEQLQRRDFQQLTVWLCQLH